MRHKGHIRQRSKGSFELRYDIGADPLTGKRRTETVTFKGERKDAEAELRRIVRSLDTNEYVKNTKITVRDFLKQWLETIRSQVSIKTHESYTETVNHFLIAAFGGIQLGKLQPTAIQQAYNNWENGGRRDGKNGGLSARSRLYIHRILKSALKHALQLQLIVRNPADAIKSPRIKKTAITTLAINAKYWPCRLAECRWHGNAVRSDSGLDSCSGCSPRNVLALNRHSSNIAPQPERHPSHLQQIREIAGDVYVLREANEAVMLDETTQKDAQQMIDTVKLLRGLIETILR